MNKAATSKKDPTDAHPLVKTEGRSASGKVSNGKIFGEAFTSLRSLEAEIVDMVWRTALPTHAMEMVEATLHKRRA